MASFGMSARPFARLATKAALTAVALTAGWMAAGATVHQHGSAPLAARPTGADHADVTVQQRHVQLAALPVVPQVPSTVGPPHPAPTPVGAAGQSYRNFLTGDDGLHTLVTTYGDCNGTTPLTHTSAAIDTCVTDHLYFVGHNPGVFTPLMRMGVGSLITYWDNDGVPHTVRVIAVVVWSRPADMPPPTPGATMEFQTCANADGSILRNLEAAPA